MVDTPDRIKDTIDSNTYKMQDYDVSNKIRKAICDKRNYIVLEYHTCPKLKKELQSKGYRVTETVNWFFGEQTIIRWQKFS